MGLIHDNITSKRDGSIEWNAPLGTGSMQGVHAQRFFRAWSGDAVRLQAWTRDEAHPNFGDSCALEVPKSDALALARWIIATMSD